VGGECLTDSEVNEMSEDIVVNATLPAAIVDAAKEDGTIEPVQEGETAVRMAGVYPGMAGGHEAHLFIQPQGATKEEIDAIAIRANQTTAPYLFVEFAVFAQYVRQAITVFWEIRSGPQLLHTTRELTLKVEAGFEGEQTLDLTSQNYGVVVGKPPANSPPFTRFSRVATWGVEPHAYASSDAKVATVDQQGEVTANGNGKVTISATDSLGQTKHYVLTVNGILLFHFLTPGASWQGANDACRAAGLDLPSERELTRLVDTYPEHRGSLTDFFGFLPYGFWAGDLSGANTAPVVNLDKPMDDDLDPNPSSADLNEHHQAMGVSRS
jgi:hypothetical protein